MLQHSLLVLVVVTIETFVRSEPLWKDVCTQHDVVDLPFCDTSLNVDRRVDDLLRRIPTDRQIKMMVNDASGYDPLYIPPYQWWNEGLHGVYQEECFSSTLSTNRTACPTSFPCPSALATSFNDTLFYRVAGAIGKEGRAISNIRHHNGAMGDGLTFWTPVVNMHRDPRWGRNQEVPGEDPFLTSRFAVQFIKGLQQVGYSEARPDHPMQVAACCKHFVANSLELWNHTSRHNFDAQISKEDLHEYYYPPFVACVQHGDVAGIMCSYNAVNGIPSCVNQHLLQQVLRKDWQFQGYVTSDCFALTDVHTFHHYTDSPVQTAALAINATTNLNCGRVYIDYLPFALEQGLVTAQAIEDNFRILLTVQMKLGMFDQPKTAYDDLGVQDIDSPEHQALALEAALQSIVLLQNTRLNNTNDNQSAVLPLQSGQKIAVIGPHVNATTALLGNYRGWRCSTGVDEDCVVTPLAAITQANTGGTTRSALGCHVDGPVDEIAKARDVAASADAIILLVGLDRSQENEGLDRVHTTLPGLQIKLVEMILQLNNPQTILVLISGGSLSLGYLRDKAPAIVSAGYGGQAAAAALAQVLFGTYNPSGRLAATMYPPEYSQQMALTDMSLRDGVGRTHMFYRGAAAEFTFGYGLSYSSWNVHYEYTYDPHASQLTLLANLTNQGPLPGRQSILLLAVPTKRPQTSRKALQKLVQYGGTEQILKVGQSEILSLTIDTAAFLELPHVELVVLEPNGIRKNLGSWNSLVGETSTKPRRKTIESEVPL